MIWDTPKVLTKIAFFDQNSRFNTKLIDMTDEYLQQFRNHIRPRVCGILIENNKILLLKHIGIGEAGLLWLPPGGGINFGESLKQALHREFKEETGLTIKVNQLYTVHEFIQPPLHAIEFFFDVERLGGELLLGNDPELPPEQQLSQDVACFSYEELRALPSQHYHRIFQAYTSFEEFMANCSINRLK